MSFEIPLDLEPEVERYAQDAQLTSDAAIRRIVEDGLRQTVPRAKRGARPPLRTDNPEATIGLFADMPNFVEIIAEVIASRAERYGGER